jgi:anti-sigma factor ChrR (cupin superfamily)
MATAAVANAKSRIISVSEIEWKQMTPMVKTKTLLLDPDKKRRVQLTRFEPGAALPTHRHVGDELLYVVEGSISDEAGTTSAGNVGYRPNGCVHTVTSKNGATVYAIVTGGVEPATEIGNAPRSQTFVLSDIPWVEGRPGMKHKQIWEDPATKRRIALVRHEPGSRLPLHHHIGDEVIFLIEGSNADEAGEVLTGNVNHRVPGTIHSVTSKNGGTVLSVVTGDVEMLE